MAKRRRKKMGMIYRVGPGADVSDYLAFKPSNGDPLRGVCAYGPGGQGDFNSGQVFTISVASPAVISCTAHGRSVGQTVMLNDTSGHAGETLPTGVAFDTLYWIISAGFTADQFEISATPGGAAINTSGGAGSGTHHLSSYYNATPYDQPGVAHTMNPDARIDYLLSIGFNHMRCSYNLGSVMALIEAGQSTTTVINTILDDMTFFVNRGMKVIIDNHWSNFGQDPVPGYSNRACTDSSATGKIAIYRSAIVALATALNARSATLPPSMAALELCNEPPNALDIAGGVSWEVQQPITYRQVRAVLPNHTIFLTGRQFARSETLIELSYVDYNRDPNVIFVFHMYDPGEFTNTAYSADLTWPPDISQKGTAPFLSVPNAYWDTPWNQAWIDSSFFAPIQTWRLAQGIKANQIWCGEFGATDGNADASRTAYNSAVANLCQSYGFGWNLYALRTSGQDLVDRSGATWTTFLSFVTNLPGINL